MPRTPRRDIIRAGCQYHVVARGNNGLRLFDGPEDYRYYMDRLLESKRRFGVSLFHYMLMPNHVHLQPSPSCDRLDDFMHAVQMPFAKRFCRLRRFAGHVWQGRYKSFLIDSDAYSFACGNYIEMNPVRAGLVPTPEDWPYSSYRYYAFGALDALVDRDPFYDTLGSNDAERQERYRQLVTRTRARS